MKKAATILIFCLSFYAVITVYAQEPGKYNKPMNIAGEFHIGLNDFAHIEDAGSRFSIAPRIGYSFTDLDMVFVDFTISAFNKSGYKGSNFETSMVYRRYLKSGQLRPYMQFGIGAGYLEQQEISCGDWEYRNYYKAETGVGVSYRYKRWTFEAGMKGIYNQYGNGRVQLAPMVGVSFSF